MTLDGTGHGVVHQERPFVVPCATLTLDAALAWTLGRFALLAIVMPWLAYATWHAYRETLDASDWPGLD